MSPAIASTAPADILDVFNAYDGGVIFSGLTSGSGGQASVLGKIGWIFTSLGAVFTLWGFVLRTRHSAADDKVWEAAKTWIVFAFMMGAPLLMRAAMESADSIYASSVGGPANLTTACVKAAYAMPELSQLFDVLRKNALAQGATSPNAASSQRAALIDSANDGSALGYVEAYGVAVWDTAANYASGAADTWNGMVRLAAMAMGFGSAMFKCLLIALALVPLYLLFLAAASIVWFMQQLRFFLAVSGTMMLPLFIGMFSLPHGHFNRQAAQSYVMHMVSLALWPVAWAIGHTGTIALYNALVSLIAGTSRVPQVVDVMQWSSVTGVGATEAQVHAAEAALGNWFMGNMAALLSIVVGGLGFTLWVFVVSVLGPAFLHKLLASGAMFMSQALQSTAVHAVGSVRLAAGAAQGIGLASGAGLFASGPGPGERLSSSSAVEGVSLAATAGATGRTSMSLAARDVDDSGGKSRPPV